MHKLFMALALAASAWATVANSAEYQATVRRVDANLYQLNNRSIYAITRYCYEYSYGDDVIIEWNGYSGQIIWENSETKCDLKKVLSAAVLTAGVYKITVNREEENLYEVVGQNTYVMTQMCLSLALGSTAYLDWNGSSGKLIFSDENDRCDAQVILRPIT